MCAAYNLNYFEVNSSTGLNFEALGNLIASRLCKDAVEKKRNVTKDLIRNYKVERGLYLIVIFLLSLANGFLGALVGAVLQGVFIYVNDIFFQAEKWYYQVGNYVLVFVSICASAPIIIFWPQEKLWSKREHY